MGQHWGAPRLQLLFAATVAGLLTSLATSGLKRLIGYADADNSYPGRVRLDV